MKKTLYLHGLGGYGLNKKDIDKFKTLGLDVKSLTIDYRSSIGNNFLILYLIEFIRLNNIELVIGNSMGGFFAYHLSNICEIDGICLNPAISDKTLSYKWFYETVSSYSNENMNNKIDIFIGDNDTVVDHEYGIEYLNDNHIGNILNIKEFSCEHRIPMQLKFNLIGEIVKQKKEVEF